MSTTQVQVPDKSILDINGKQTYLGNTFIVGTDVNTIATTSETPILLMSNSSSNSKSLFIQVKKLLCYTSGQSAIFKIYYNPTVTSAGTAQTPVNLKTGSTLSPIASVSMNPTVSANGTYTAALVSANQSQTVSDVLQIIDPGTSMLITVTLSQLNARFLSEVIWYEL